MDAVSYDLAVIGSGAAGFAAAMATRRRSRSVVMIERDTIGGTCVNTGCVPSKALLAAARTAEGTGRFPGISSTEAVVDFAAVSGGVQALVGRMRREKYVDLAAAHGWEIVRGAARFTGDAETPSLRVNGRTIAADHYLVATGSEPWTPPITGLTEYLTSTTALQLDALPASLIVLGGGPTGLEFAQVFARLGVDVTVVEAADRLAPGEEPEISAGIATAFVAAGINVVTGARIGAVHRETHGYRLTGVNLRAERLLVATGRRPVTDRLGLDAVGVKVGDRGEVLVDRQLRSSNPRIWAAGDVTGHPQFVYVAARHGTLIAENAFDDADRAVDYTALPRVTFTDPAIASVGLAETDGHESRLLPLEHLPRAIVDRDTHGLIKIVAERGTGRIVGVHALAANAGELITTAAYAVRAGLTVAELADGWAPYLTTTEGLRLAAQAFTRDITTLTCCAS